MLGRVEVSNSSGTNGSRKLVWKNARLELASASRLVEALGCAVLVGVAEVAGMVEPSGATRLRVTLRVIRVLEASDLDLRVARSRLYRRRFLQVDTPVEALAEIYTIHTFAQISDIKISIKIASYFLLLQNSEFLAWKRIFWP